MTNAHSNLSLNGSRTRFGVRAAAITLHCLLGACQSDPTDRTDFGTPAGAQPCTPGEQQACACPGGQPDGVQVCAEDGDRFGACMGCDPMDVDDDGAGTGGSAGDEGAGTSDGADDDGTDGSATASAGSEDTGPLPGWPSGPPQSVPPGPPPDAYAIVEQTANELPELLAASCVDTGGNNEFLFEVVRRLRAQDDRWALNWKRGVIGDMSQDVVDYHWGEGPSEESTDVYIIDIIVGHCGDDPQPGWIDVTGATLEAGEVGMWTLAGQDL